MDNKAFLNKLSQQMGGSVQDASTYVEAFATVLRERAADLDSIAIPGFGNFVTVKQQEKIETDTDSGQRMLTPPQIKIEFVASAMLKKQVLEQ